MSKQETEQRPLSYSGLQPILTGDEWLILQALDPKHKLTSEVEASLLSDSANDEYRRMVHDGRADPLPGVRQKPYAHALERREIEPTEERSHPTGSGNPSGGFAFLPLLGAAAPLLAGVIGPAIQGIVGLFKKKKSGSGVWAPNFRGSGVLEDFFSRNADRLRQMEDQLAGLKGRDFWHNLRNMATGELKKIVPKIVDVTPKIAEHVASLAVKKVIPSTLQKFAAEKSGSGRHGSAKYPGRGISVANVGKSIAKWVVGKILQHSPTARSIQKKISGVSDYLDSARPLGSGMRPSIQGVQHLYRGPIGGVIGSADTAAPPPDSTTTDDYWGPEDDDDDDYIPYRELPEAKKRGFFQRAKDFAKKVVNTVIPSALKTGSKAIGTVVDSILSKVGVENAFVGDIVKGVVESSSQKLQEGPIFKEDPEEDIEDLLGDIDPRLLHAKTKKELRELETTLRDRVRARAEAMKTRPRGVRSTKVTRKKTGRGFATDHPFHQWREEHPGGTLREWMMSRRPGLGYRRPRLDRSGQIPNTGPSGWLERERRLNDPPPTLHMERIGPPPPRMLAGQGRGKSKKSYPRSISGVKVRMF